MASIEARTTRKGIRYRARITLNGHPRLSETFTTRRAAEYWMPAGIFATSSFTR